MDMLTILALAVALGTDAFSLSVGIGLGGVRLRQLIVVSLTVLAFHIIMPLIGYFVGEWFGSMGRIANIAGALVLIFLGLKMIKESLDGGIPDQQSFVIANTMGLVLLAGSVSLDALSVGFTLGTQRVNLSLAVITMGIVAGVMTAAGMVLGKYAGKFLGSKAEIFGGLVLLGIGIKLVW